MRDSINTLHDNILNEPLENLADDFGVQTPASVDRALEWAQGRIINRISHQVQYGYTSCVCESLLDFYSTNPDPYAALIDLYDKIQKVSATAEPLTSNGWSWQTCTEVSS